MLAVELEGDHPARSREHRADGRDGHPDPRRDQVQEGRPVGRLLHDLGDGTARHDGGEVARCRESAGPRWEEHEGVPRDLFSTDARPPGETVRGRHRGDEALRVERGQLDAVDGVGVPDDREVEVAAQEPCEEVRRPALGEVDLDERVLVAELLYPTHGPERQRRADEADVEPSLLSPGDPHHLVEAQFKAFARAFRDAVAIDARETGVPSTKGSL